MNYQTTISKLYFLLISADGKINESEIAFGEKMAELEGLQIQDFRSMIDILKGKDSSTIFLESISGLKRLDQKKQIRAIAWLCAVANSDGFMDKTEWQFIYNLYHKELSLSMDAIMAEQKELSRSIRELSKKKALAIL
jgi:uncharacterized tellurite resistance protein B-like protein